MPSNIPPAIFRPSTLTEATLSEYIVLQDRFRALHTEVESLRATLDGVLTNLTWCENLIHADFRAGKFNLVNVS